MNTTNKTDGREAQIDKLIETFRKRSMGLEGMGRAMNSETMAAKAKTYSDAADLVIKLLKNTTSTTDLKRPIIRASEHLALVNHEGVVPVSHTHGVTSEQWASEIFSEYLAKCPFFNFMGTSSHNIIQVKEELTKAAGDAVTVQLRAKLTGSGVTGATELKGTEEDLVFFDQRIGVDTLRHGVILKGDMNVKREAFDLRNTAREALSDWSTDKLRSDIIAALTQTNHGRDRSRYLYGISDTNWNATHATALANCDGTNDKLNTTVISRAKRKAMLEGSRKIRPFTVKNGTIVEEIFVLFAHPYAVRDLLNDPDFKAANTFTPANLRDSGLLHSQGYKGMWDGVAVFEAAMPILTAAGCSGINLSHSVLCGAQAVAVTWGKRTVYREDPDNYGSTNGFAVDEIRGVSKLVFNNVDHGLVNVFTAAIAD